MTDDDKPHEYIPHEWRDIAVGTRDECRERIAQLEAERDELQDRCNTLAGALHFSSAQLATAEVELEEAQDERDGYRNRWQMLERDIEPLRALANRVPILEENVARLATERNWYLLARNAARDECGAARQSRKRAVWAARELRERLKNYDF